MLTTNKLLERNMIFINLISSSILLRDMKLKLHIAIKNYNDKNRNKINLFKYIVL